MNIQQIIKKQGWTRQKNEKNNAWIYRFEDDPSTLKIFFTDDGIKLKELKDLKNELWNTYYPRVLIYKDSSQYKAWANNQSPKSHGKNLDDKLFEEKTSPIEYWSKYIPDTPKNTVDKKLEKSILTVFQELDDRHFKKDDLVSIILACTFIRFLEDRDLTDVPEKLIDVLSSKKKTKKLFEKYNDLHNGILFKQDTLYELNNKTCQILKDFLEDNLFDQKSLFYFDFRYIPIELISNIYEKLLTEKLGEEQKKAQGITYTPPKLANYLTKEAFKQLDQKIDGKNWSKIRIGDLSTGSGIFLVLSFRELLKRIDKTKVQVLFKEKKKILKDSFYGIDLDKSAINITTFSLYIELLENEKKKLTSNNKFPILKNIKKQDALLYSECNTFFDLVIGNPPWGSKSDYFKKIEGRKFEKNIGNKELAQIFVNIGIEKLRDDGILALVLPSASFYNSSSFDFRNSLLNNILIKNFIDFSPIRKYIFKNGVENSVIIGEKNNSIPYSYIIPIRRVINKADYLYFNHISGITHDIDSNFLRLRKDSWQIAIRGGNIAVSFIEKLSNDFILLKEIEKIFIGTGYQAKKTGDCATVSEDYSAEFNKTLYLINDSEIVQKYTNLKKSGKSHILFNEKFYGDSLGVANSYKYEKGLITKYFKRDSKRVISGDFNIITGDKDTLYFVVVLLKSRLGEFLINLQGAKTSLLKNERQNPKILKEDIEKLFIPNNYADHKDIINIGREIVGNDFSKSQEYIDKKIEDMYKINKLDIKLLDQWEKITKRKEIIEQDMTKSYQEGFEYMLDSYKLPKPKKWGDLKVINGAEIISFSETSKQPNINNNKIREGIKDIVIAKEDMYFNFMTDDKGIIIRRQESNYGFLTGLLDAETILNSL